jgi:hypothetical protein
MKSKIMVDYDFDKKETFLQLRLEGFDEDGGDLPDKHLKNFIEEANAAGSMSVQYFGAGNGLPQIRVKPKLTEEEYLELHHVRINAEYLEDWGDHKPYEKGKSYNLMFCTTQGNCILVKDSGHIVRENGFRKYHSLHQFLEYWSVNPTK